jgi:pseudouridylate synthase
MRVHPEVAAALAAGRPVVAAVLAARRADGATTVAATAHLAARAGIAVFATGGLGGVHRDSQETFDESADLRVLARSPILPVCSGVKSILDVPATLERLETLSVGVLGYRTDTFPAFYLRDSGQRVPWRVESAAEIAAAWRARQGMGTEGYGLVIANPVPLDAELNRELHDRTLAAGIAAARAADVHGRDVTPFLLAFFHRETGGQSVAANVALVRDNARLAAAVAVELASH